MSRRRVDADRLGPDDCRKNKESTGDAGGEFPYHYHSHEDMDVTGELVKKEKRAFRGSLLDSLEIKFEA